MFWGMPQRHGLSAIESRGHGVDSGGSETDLILALDMSQHPVRIGRRDRAVPTVSQTSCDVDPRLARSRAGVPYTPWSY